MEKIVFERNRRAAGEGSVMIRRGKCPAGRMSSVNWHDHIELLFCAEGKGRVLLEDRKYDFVPGTFITVGSQVIHSLSAEEDVHYFLVHIDKTFFTDNGIGGEPLFSECAPEGLAPEKELKRLLLAAEEESYTQAKINRAAISLVLYMCENLLDTSNTAHRPGLQFERAKRVMIYLKENFHRTLTLDEITAQAGINKYQLTREFKQITGTGIFDFLNYHRVSEAKKLLKAGSTVSEAALACGFQNLSYFSRTYKRYMGELPSEVKKRA